MIPTTSRVAKCKQTQNSQDDKTVKRDILFFNSLSPLPGPSHPFSYFSPISFLSLSQFFHIFSLLRCEATPLKRRFEGALSCFKWSLGQQSPAANTFLRHCELSKRKKFGGSNFGLLSSAKEVKISNVGAIDRPFVT